MPRGDGTGPMGFGPMTGRAMGYCAGYAVPGYANPGPGFGAYGWGRGRGGGGRGRRHRYYATGLTGWQRAAGMFPGAYAPPVPTREGELEMLRAQAEQMTGVLEDIQTRIAELEKTAERG